MISLLPRPSTAPTGVWSDPETEPNTQQLYTAHIHIMRFVAINKPMTKGDLAKIAKQSTALAYARSLQEMSGTPYEYESVKGEPVITIPLGTFPRDTAQMIRYIFSNHIGASSGPNTILAARIITDEIDVQIARWDVSDLTWSTFFNRKL